MVWRGTYIGAPSKLELTDVTVPLEDLRCDALSFVARACVSQRVAGTRGLEGLSLWVQRAWPEVRTLAAELRWAGTHLYSPDRFAKRLVSR